jgi:hypothetical protein
MMKKLIYRLPRYHVDLPVVLHFTARTISGRCTDISSEGVGVRLLDEPLVGESVILEFVLRGKSVRANARVEYRSDINFYGLRFQFSSESERQSITQLIESQKGLPHG